MDCWVSASQISLSSGWGLMLIREGVSPQPEETLGQLQEGNQDCSSWEKVLRELGSQGDDMLEVKVCKCRFKGWGG